MRTPPAIKRMFLMQSLRKRDTTEKSCRELLGQQKENIGACEPIRKNNDDRFAKFKTAQKGLNIAMMAKERLLSSLQARRIVLNSTSPGKRSVTGETKIFESKTPRLYNR